MPWATTVIIGLGCLLEPQTLQPGRWSLPSAIPKPCLAVWMDWACLPRSVYPFNPLQPDWMGASWASESPGKGLISNPESGVLLHRHSHLVDLESVLVTSVGESSDTLRTLTCQETLLCLPPSPLYLFQPSWDGAPSLQDTCPGSHASAGPPVTAQ